MQCPGPELDGKEAMVVGRASAHHLFCAASAQAGSSVLLPGPQLPSVDSSRASSQGRRGALPGIQQPPPFSLQVEALLGDHVLSPRAYQQW